MPNAKIKNYLHLHLLVFIAGFTAILGELITIGSMALVWYRMLIAGFFMLVYIMIKGVSIKVPIKAITKFSIAGIIIALHWITFFEAINQSNISITLAMFSTGAFFASLIEPLFFKRKVIGYEIVFGLVVIFGVVLITKTEYHYLNGILLGVTSALLSTLFAVINGKLVKNYRATVISFYEFMSGVLFISLFIAVVGNGFTASHFSLSQHDWAYLFILASICTAYAFIAGVHVMKKISPYTVVLTYNMEPVYGIVLALIVFPNNEKMSVEFYIGAVLIISTVILNGILKNSKTIKNRIPKDKSL